MDQGSVRVFTVFDSRLKCIYAVYSFQVVRELMSDYLFRIGICYKAQVKQPLAGSDICYIANPDLFRTINLSVL